MKEDHGSNATRIRRRRESGDLRIVVQGKQMKFIESMVHAVGRFVFGLGLGVAATSVYVIVSGVPDVLGPVPAVEVVRLDPVVVTISKERFDALHAELASSGPVHLFGHGPQQV